MTNTAEPSAAPAEELLRPVTPEEASAARARRKQLEWKITLATAPVAVLYLLLSFFPALRSTALYAVTCFSLLFAAGVDSALYKRRRAETEIISSYLRQTRGTA